MEITGFRGKNCSDAGFVPFLIILLYMGNPRFSKKLNGKFQIRIGS
jgi:hypothetical protein